MHDLSEAESRLDASEISREHEESKEAKASEISEERKDERRANASETLAAGVEREEREDGQKDHPLPDEVEGETEPSETPLDRLKIREEKQLRRHRL